MWTLRLHMVAICLALQVTGCFPSCLIKGSVAHCAHRKLRWVPPLPPHITRLHLEMNDIGEINATSLSGLGQLQELDLGLQKVPLVIRNNAFSRQSRLRKLVLHSNTRLQLEPLAFAGLSSLQNLYLDYCFLNESILEDNYLQPLSSLETLNLFGNQIRRLQPSMFFANMTKLTGLNLKLNKIDKICESDVVGFEGKHFSVFNLNSVPLKAMSSSNFDWKKCGNPLRGMSFQVLDLSHNRLSVNHLRLFFRAIDGAKISHLKLSGHMGRGFSFSNLPDPDNSTFEGLKNSSVLSLDLSKNRIFALQQGLFSPLKEVTAIDLSRNRVNEIHRQAFQGLQNNLQVLNLSHNLLGEIYSHTFASLTSLRLLDLSHNHIGGLGYGSFSALPNLKVLYLTGNSLRDLGFPAALPSLDYLLLNDNKLIPSSVYSLTQFASNVTYLSIEDNKLTNLEDVSTFVNQFKHLRSLLYGGNRVRWCNTSSSQVGPNNVTVLDLHSVSLQHLWTQGKCLNLFDNFGNVTLLILSFNELQSLPGGVFKGLTSAVEMDLSHNALTYLQPDVLPKTLRRLDISNNFLASPDPAALRSLSYVDLSVNRFHCSSKLGSFLTWLNQTNVTFSTPIQELRCEFPSAFHNVPLLDYFAQVTQQ
ncbi:toll-like receptor 5 [Cololabis saira]|uniref:toll-like receptor 5 n=1 Tax=Cololabis saira TaxID=129043 RepID=UPI002AD1D80E|nr:toll-like receptor 5 [Cololabis saira]